MSEQEQMAHMALAILVMDLGYDWDHRPMNNGRHERLWYMCDEFFGREKLNEMAKHMREQATKEQSEFFKWPEGCKCRVIGTQWNRVYTDPVDCPLHKDRDRVTYARH